MASESSLCHLKDAPADPVDLLKSYLKENEQTNNEVLPIVTINLATLNDEYGVLNRTVRFRGFEGSDVIFVTERDSQKYRDIQKNAKVAITFLFSSNEDDGTAIIKQVRLNGDAIELSKDKIANLWSEEEIHAKLRSYICECGKPANWDELKIKHDTLLKSYKSGEDDLKQTETYTAFHVRARVMDFYYAKSHTIGDRVVYRRKDGSNSWHKEHVCA